MVCGAGAAAAHYVGAAWGAVWVAALILLLGWPGRHRCNGNAATAVPLQPPLAELDFWKVQLPASLRVPLGYSEFAM